MEKARLTAAVKILNEATYREEGSEEDKPLLATKVRTVAVKDEVLKTNFIAACNTLIGTEVEDYVPDEVVDVYNELVPVDATATETKIETPATKKKDKAPATKKAGGNLPVREKDDFGSAVGTMSSAINDALAKGATMESLKKMLADDWDRKEGAEAKIRGHIKFMQKERGAKVVEKDGVFTITKK